MVYTRIGPGFDGRHIQSNLTSSSILFFRVGGLKPLCETDVELSSQIQKAAGVPNANGAAEAGLSVVFGIHAF